MSEAKPRSVLHVDMDAFYASIEQRDHPELRGKPVIVGADPKGGKGRGVVATCSYEARKFGVGSAMPISRAWQLCPHGVYVRPDMASYEEASSRVMEIFRRFTDLVEPVSIDEAFLDVTGSRRVHGTGPEIAAKLKRAIRGELELTASVGVATSKLVAKIASDIRKPDGLVVVEPGTEAAFLAPMTVRRLWGVGPKMEEVLLAAGIRTIGDLATLPAEKLERRLGTHGLDLQALARGEDDRPVLADSGPAKSIGQEHTFDVDTRDVEVLRRTLLELSDMVARRLRAAHTRARTVTLKYRDEDFHTVTRAETVPETFDAGDAVFAIAWRLFTKTHGRRRVRLLGVSASHLSAGGQMGLFDAPAEAAPDKLRDEVEQRFGEGSLTRASLLPSPGREPASLDRKGSRRLRRGTG